MNAKLVEAVRLLASGNATEVEVDVRGMTLVVKRLRRQRATLTQERLQRIAELHAEGGVAAVERELKRSRSQAYRLVRLAIDAGLIKEAPRAVPAPTQRVRVRLS